MDRARLLNRSDAVVLFCVLSAPVLAETVMQTTSITSQSGFGNPVPDEVFTFTGFDSPIGALNYDYSPSVVPIPAAAWLFASALGLITWIARNSDAHTKRAFAA